MESNHAPRIWSPLPSQTDRPYVLPYHHSQSRKCANQSWYVSDNQPGYRSSSFGAIGMDSNPRHVPYRGTALPTELRRRESGAVRRIRTGTLRFGRPTCLAVEHQHCSEKVGQALSRLPDSDGSDISLAGEHGRRFVPGLVHYRDQLIPCRARLEVRAGVSPARCAIETGRRKPGVFRPGVRSHQPAAELALPLHSRAGHPLRPHHRFTVSRLNRSTEHSQAVVFLQQSKFSKILGNFRGVPGDREPGVPFTWKIFKIWNAEYMAITVTAPPPQTPGRSRVAG